MGGARYVTWSIVPHPLNCGENMNYTSSCHCGETHITLSLPKPLGKYTPRACDCNFCTARRASYLSDPNGILEITNEVGLEQLKQGSEQAIFWHCASCSDLICVTCEFDNVLLGAVNSKLLSKNNSLQHPVPVSPQKLSPEQKRERWKEIWMPVNFIV